MAKLTLLPFKGLTPTQIDEVIDHLLKVLTLVISAHDGHAECRLN